MGTRIRNDYWVSELWWFYTEQYITTISFVVSATIKVIYLLYRSSKWDSLNKKCGGQFRPRHPCGAVSSWKEPEVAMINIVITMS